MGSIFLSHAKKLQISLLLEANKDTALTYSDDVAFKDTFLKLVSGKIDDKLIYKDGFIRDPEIDQTYYDIFLESRLDLKYKKMLKKREHLPAYDMRQQIIDMIDKNQICVISGETGCGKTTQVGQFILDDHLLNKKGSICKIICTQPRRLSAISVALRVAEERGENLGSTVGYQIRLEK